ncbi:MAG: glycosyl hydrolase [Gammaproteobacteria bacterium]|nr:glycosyl hydrolase [Gammaproteobacteria bacterium]MDH3768246.1 glycosyl hydrolase [Gammaproteobacteria bacterium]
MSRIYLLLAGLLASLSLSLHAADETEPEPGLNEKTFEGLSWRAIGPAFMSGRISDIAIDPNDRATWYVAVGSGGVWKTVNAGTTWKAVFEKEASYSIGSVTIDPNNSQTIWVGSGENVSGRHVGYGDGIYRSLDGGESWENMGLKDSDHIGTIRIDPRDSKVIFVAAQGPLWSPGGERGLYRSADGGKEWEQILSAGEYTGVGEVHMDPRNPDVLYATTWQRHRTVAALLNGGPESGIHKSTDGGDTWTKLEKGLPEVNMGKIGLAISSQKPDVVYAAIETTRRKGGFYRSEDGGATWEKRSDYVASGTGPHYYQEIFASPHQFDRIYHMDVYLHISEDGGKNFTKTRRGAKHVDHHALAFDADDPDYLIVGNDGGVYESFDLGKTWRFISNLPITQFYKVSVDYDEPFYNIYGGTQDNSSQGGPSRTDHVSGIRNSDWKIILGGDGHQPFADPSNPDIVYAQWQQGNLNRYDRRTGETIYIQPQPEKGAPPERFNWDAPILISAHDPQRLYFASQRLWRSNNRGDSWTAVSTDLTRNQDRLNLPIMGRRHSFDEPWDLYAMSMYNTIANIAESPLDEELLYAGTDDGLIHVSTDGGENWRRAGKLSGVPDYFYVNDIKADLHDADTVYVAVDNHKAGDYQPYLFKSTDRGRSWRRISRGIPDRHLVWRIVQDHVKPGLLFAGTEFGVFFTIDGGGNWTKLSGNTPNIPFRDLVIQKRENDLVGATFGRSFFVLDDYTALRHVTVDMLENNIALFPVRKTRWYMPRLPLGCMMPNCPESQGNAYFVAPNPPFGAVFTYYVNEPIRSKKDQRLETEKPLNEAGKDIGFPGWDVVNEESWEDEPAMVFTITDAQDNTISQVEGPVTAGFHRVAWDLRYPSPEPWVAEPDPEPWSPSAGTLAAPGTYTVSLSQRIDGKLKSLSQSQNFDVVSIREPSIAGITQEARVAFLRKVDAIERDVRASISAIDELIGNTTAMKETLTRSIADPQLYDETHRIEKRARQLRERLAGNEQRNFMSEPGPMPIDSRIYVAGSGDRTSAHGPTQTQRRSLEIAEEEFAVVGRDLKNLLEVELRELREKLDTAGVPWSPGRGGL